MTDWFMKIKEDYNLNEQNEELRNRFYVLNEGSHNIKIDLSTKDKFTKESKFKDKVTYILFKTVDAEKPYLKLTTYQYGLLLKKLASLQGFDTGLIPKTVRLLVNVTKEDNDKLIFDISVVPGDAGDHSE